VRSLWQAEQLWSVRDVRDLPHEVRGAIVDVLYVLAVPVGRLNHDAAAC